MELTLVKKQPEKGDVVSFFWQAEPKFTWLPGQYLYYTVKLEAPDSRGNVRHFTIAASPTEENIQLTTHITDSAFKLALNKLEVGAKVQGVGPRGDFVLNEEKKEQQVFLAGGIGITPFRSMIKFATDKNLATPIHLIYSNSTPEEIVFKEQLDTWAQQNKNLAISYTITKPEEAKSPWPGLTGRINSEMINSLVTTDFWVCGPPAFVGGMQEELEKLKVDPEKVELEQFTGY